MIKQQSWDISSRHGFSLQSINTYSANQSFLLMGRFSLCTNCAWGKQWLHLCVSVFCLKAE